MRRWINSGLLALLALASLAASARSADDRRERRQEERRREARHREERREDREDRKYWRERDKAERKYWKEREKEARKHERHRYEGPDHRRMPPPWMNGYWRADDHRRYVALVPGDPSRIYVFLDGRWVLRQIRDPRARLDLEGAFHLPVAPPPVAPPRLGVNLHIVLFN